VLKLYHTAESGLGPSAWLHDLPDREDSDDLSVGEAPDANHPEDPVDHPGADEEGSGSDEDDAKHDSYPLGHGLESKVLLEDAVDVCHCE
jgi:hypothetical protein